MKSVKLSPIVKWVGGKRQLLKVIDKHLPEDFSKETTAFYEPFIGGGAVLFYLQPHSAVINDTNEELVNLYRTVKDKPDELIADLRRHRNDHDYFYEIRRLDRNGEVYQRLTEVERASRIIFLNKTCYNGLYRVNSKGQYNAPFGRYKNPDFVSEKRIRAVSEYFNNNNVQIMNKDFEDALDGISTGSFVYFDPPYDPVSDSANFTSYSSSGFGKEQQCRLKDVCDRLTEKGVRFLLSNSATPFMRDLYKDYHVTIVGARRAVNSKAEKRGAVDEVLVRNYSLTS